MPLLNPIETLTVKQPNHKSTHPFLANLLTACALLAGHAAQAHDIVLVPQAGGLDVRYGHPKDWLPVDHEKLIELQAIPAAGPAVDRHDALVRRGLDLQLKPAAAAGATLFAARYDNGLWVQRPAADGAPAAWRNTGRFLLPDAQGVMLSLKFAKAWAGKATDGQQYRQSVGHLLELVPQKNPRALAAGANPKDYSPTDYWTLDSTLANEMGGRPSFSYPSSVTYTTGPTINAPAPPATRRPIVMVM